ncbi:hypothetical protein MD484_g8093, partial [Candolleomyces efflorescens]
MLLGQTLRLLLLRCILVSAIVNLAFHILIRYTPGIVILSETTLHHLLSACGPCVPLFGWIDILLIVLEISFNIWSLWHITTGEIPFRWIKSSLVLWVFSAWILIIALVVLLGVKIIQHIDERGKKLSRKVDIMRDHLKDSESNPDKLERQIEGWRYPVRALFGIALWERKFPGEPRWIAIYRGLLCLTVLSAITVYGVFALVLDPVSEMGMLPSRELRNFGLATKFATDDPITWNMILVWPTHVNTTKHLRDAVSLIPLWPRFDDDIDGPPCSLIDKYGDGSEVTSATFMNKSLIGEAAQVAVFTCPSHPSFLPLVSKLGPWAFLKSRRLTQPDLKLTVNFTELLDPSGQPGDFTIGSISLEVYLALTNNTSDVLLSTRATPLLPGTNVVGYAELVLRQRIDAAHLSTLGLFDTTNANFKDISYIYDRKDDGYES